PDYGRYCMLCRLEPFVRAVGGRIIRFIYRPKISGFEQVPAAGPVLLIANHVSFIDGLLISAACNRPVRFVIYKPLYELPVLHWGLRLNRAIPIYPKREIVEAALDAIADGLAAGDAVCIFP